MFSEISYTISHDFSEILTFFLPVLYIIMKKKKRFYKGADFMSLHTSDLVLVPGQQLPPLETISGFQVRPGFFRFFGATVIPGGVNFTIQSHGATSCELLFFRKGEEEPFAVLPFPRHYRI